jgi:hypothetical protein
VAWWEHGYRPADPFQLLGVHIDGWYTNRCSTATSVCLANFRGSP